jgi:hypothetical protein
VFVLESVVLLATGFEKLVFHGKKIIISIARQEKHDFLL